MSVNKLLQSALWSYDLDKLDPELHKKTIITQILNHGTWEQVLWLLKNYSTEDIKNVMQNPERGAWNSEVLNYWISILNVKIPKDKMAKAIMSLKIYAK